MGTVVRIFVRDLKRVLRNPAAVLVTIGVCIIPSLYAWINIRANWNPYENTSTVPVAVVIEDTGADIPDMGHVNAGDMVRQRLEENDQLNWIFNNSKQQAIDSVRDGSAFAAFIIPSDFTSTLSGVLDGHAQSAHIDYYVNEKENAIAPKVTDTGATTLESQISSEFVRVVGEVASEKLKSASGEALDTARNGIDSTASTLRKAASQASELADGLADMDAAIAAGAVLSVVYPQMCGLGGDAFWLVHDTARGESRALNASGRAGRAVSRDKFAAPGGIPDPSAQRNCHT